MTREQDLLAILADGRFHSGQELAAVLGISRTAVWKHIRRFREKGLEITATKGKGYSLSAPVELLDMAGMSRWLEPDVRTQLKHLQIFLDTDSTSRYLRSEVEGDALHANVVFAEYQSQGRGRGSNRWLTGMAAGLCLSIGWRFDAAPEHLSALSLATGVVLARSLGEIGNQSIELKWPNDLVYQGAKLGGILIESRGQLAGSVEVIIGIGVNIHLPRAIADSIGQAVTDLTTVFGYTPSRNRLAAIIINNMFQLLDNYPSHGFSKYIDEWRKLDYGRGKRALLHLPDKDIQGIITDIDDNGHLLMSVAGKLMKYSSGDLSLRVLA